jgi:hypothetical protein
MANNLNNITKTNTSTHWTYTKVFFFLIIMQNKKKSKNIYRIEFDTGHHQYVNILHKMRIVSVNHQYKMCITLPSHHHKDLNQI